MNLPGIDLNRLFSLTEEGVEYRNNRRSIVFFFVWVILSGLTMVALVFFAANNTQRGAIVLLGLLKYIPLLMVVTAVARAKAANYLTDIYELEDENIAYNFIEEVAFGQGSEEITINEGRVSAEDERSPIILIGGPGFVQVNLDGAALLERVDGTPEIIHTRNKPWPLGRFERIREIGKSDKVGEREYAVINLRDQFVRGLTVRSRTKDGIPLEAQDVKVMFSILRKPKEEAPENDPYHFQERAVYSLVYDQIIISPPPSKTAGVSFPWDTTVIPLVITELEEIIKSNNLSEILSSISETEIEAINEGEATNVQMRIEMTSEQTAAGSKRPINTPSFQTRSKITEKFHNPEFQEKAAALGISIHWIDIGTWKLPNEMIIEELKNAWQMLRSNARRRSGLARAGKQHEMQNLLDLINHVVIGAYSRSGSSSRKLSNKENLELMKLIAENPEISSSAGLSMAFSQDAASKRDTNTVALDILRAYRNEFIAARELITKENRSPVEKQAELDRINKAMHDIDDHIFHYIKNPNSPKGSSKGAA